MSEEIIKVLNYLGEQLGIAIDWSAENVVPQVMDILGRYRILQIVNNVSLMIVFIGLLFVICCLMKKSIRDVAAKKDGIWYDRYMLSGFSMALYIVGGCALFFLIPATVMAFTDILQWIIVPEIRYFALLKSYMP